MARVLKWMTTAWVAAWLATGVAFAHAEMAKSVPADGGTAKAGLENLQFGFSMPVRVTMVKIERTDEAAEIAVLEKGTTDFTDAYSVVVAPLAEGAYSVTWIAVAKDGHVMKGGLAFTVER